MSSNRCGRAKVSLCLLLLAWLAGCGGRPAVEGPLPYPVQGQVIYQGQPAAGFRVAFVPLFEQSGPKFAPSATTGASGNFQLQSYQPGDGAPPGEYAVIFTWPQVVAGPDPDDAPLQVDRLKDRFSDPNRSSFKVTVHKGENQLEPFVLK